MFRWRSHCVFRFVFRFVVRFEFRRGLRSARGRPDLRSLHGVRDDVVVEISD